MEKVTNEVYIFFTKVWSILAWILLGLIGKFSLDVMTGKKITFIQALASAGMALFIGILASVLCEYFGYQKQAPFIVPIATLLSDKIGILIFSLNLKTALNKIGRDWASWWKDFFDGK